MFFMVLDLRLMRLGHGGAPFSFAKRQQKILSAWCREDFYYSDCALVAAEITQQPEQ